ncbi:hypothetical protein SAMN05216302_100942 [Nitrosomonas aestuarii]|uniref:Transposase n=1 Tax=Nitrosomonas aestuarii TaxID=52441 RepID=A0A1I4AJV8_9PROT|nr:hypothetical protein SAMN05216302_100942 [Nitrosomonas aestuarii]
MSKKRRNHSPEFKSKVALAAIKGDKTLTETLSAIWHQQQSDREMEETAD